MSIEQNQEGLSEEIDGHGIVKRSIVTALLLIVVSACDKQDGCGDSQS